MVSLSSHAYDSDQESIDLNELPDFGIETGIEATTTTQVSLSIGPLLDAEYAERQTTERLEQIEKEMRLFALDETECANVSFMDVEEKHAVLQPPTIPFFTLSPLQLYTQDTLTWPFNQRSDSFSDLTPDTVQKHIEEGYFMRHFISKRKPGLLLGYLFHVMSCTSDTKLMHSTYRTLKYLTQTYSIAVHLFKDVLLAVANLGGDISKFGKDVSTLSSRFVHPSNINIKQGNPSVAFRENKLLILKFLAVHLRQNNIYSPSELDDLFKICLAISIDHLILDNGCARYITNVFLSIYPSAEVSEERIKNLVNDITSYCNYHHHIIAYVCSSYLLPIQKYGIALRSALAFRQAEISLERENCKAVLINVLVENVLDLAKEQIHMFSDETDSSLLLSVMMLLDVCISDEPLHFVQRAKLQELCNILELRIKKRRGNIDDQNTHYLSSVTNRLMIKWKQKAGHVTRQQTLMEMKSNYTSPTLSVPYIKEEIPDMPDMVSG
ncbi:uncharacterized protein [Palaemon carinicauda]|uniref:uncharacterized protein n=1 Tax=Palaemon carinicauda TaxID=392227 RepID=UPI0035B6127C